jgi:NADP-dependent 3-hydroxy acid dehydrogenase YdfG
MSYGTVAFVTGASSGIGEATARALADRGAAVSLVARRRERLEELASEMERAGGRALAIEADVTDGAQAAAAVQRTVDVLGRLDTVVDNAGVMLVGPVADARVEEWQRMVDLNVEVPRSEDIADAIAYIVTRDRRVAVNEVLIRPTEQAR